MTIEQLQAMNDSSLNEIAAQFIHHWHWEQREDECRYYDVGGNDAAMTYADWQPTTDRNQSGALLEALAARCTEFEFRIVSDFVAAKSARGETIAALLAHFALENNESQI